MELTFQKKIYLNGIRSINLKKTICGKMNILQKEY